MFCSGSPWPAMGCGDAGAGNPSHVFGVCRTAGTCPTREHLAIHSSLCRSLSCKRCDLAQLPCRMASTYGGRTVDLRLHKGHEYHRPAHDSNLHSPTQGRIILLAQDRHVLWPFAHFKASSPFAWSVSMHTGHGSFADIEPSSHGHALKLNAPSHAV